MSCAICWSSEVARNAIPSGVRREQQLEPEGQRQRHREDDQREPADREVLAQVQAGGQQARPRRSARESAENSSSSTFWMMIDRPKVTSSGGRMSGPSVRFSTPR